MGDAVKKLFRAVVVDGYGYVEYLEIDVLKETPKGYWVADPATGKRRWTSGRYASPTKEEALHRCRKRALSYVKHSCIAFCDAIERCRSLGVPIPPRRTASVEALAKEVNEADWLPLSREIYEVPEEVDFL